MIKRLVRKIGKVKKGLEFASFCFRRGDDEWFTQNVMQLGKNYAIVDLKNFGMEENTGRYYHIFIPGSYAGFFSNFNRVLAYLYFADHYNLVPVIEYDRKTNYTEEHPVNGTNNPFEYYFEQPCGISLEEMKKSKGIIESRRENSWMVNELSEKKNYMRSEKYIDEMARISKKYIRLRDSIEKTIFKDIQLLLGDKKTLAVHVRGTDFKQNYNGHPVQITTEEYLEESLRIMNNGEYQQVFLATDDSDAMEKFQQKLGNKVVFYQDVFRSDGMITVMKSESSRKNHHYMLGWEVLRDVITMASCDGLVAGLSQVSYAVRIQKKSAGQTFEDLSILYKGINEHTKNDCPK